MSSLTLSLSIILHGMRAIEGLNPGKNFVVMLIDHVGHRSIINEYDCKFCPIIIWHSSY